MYTAAIGGMQLKRWTGYFRIILPTMRVLQAAKKTPGCVHADTFKGGDVFFAVSVWDTDDHMRTFATDGLHGLLTQVAMSQMKLFFNHTAQVDGVPDRQQSVALWQEAIKARDGQGTVGVYS